uniref:Centrosomal protein of 19 kDa n=1 Tax=Actinia tenebrosa TaxID=6105 RepID=A0A6P8IKQ6_ACTTE
MYSPKKCGVRYDPPTLVVFYEEKSSGKLHRRSIPIRKFNADTNISEATKHLKGSDHHLKYLQNIPHKQIEGLLQMIQDKLKGIEPIPPSSYHINVKLNPDEDMNKLDDERLRQRKAAMDIDFEKNRIKPGDDDFMYDKEIEFPDTGKVESGWDEEDDYSDPDF